jgi:5-(carboxyamino)imidazole ribonucleotide synthase
VAVTTEFENVPADSLARWRTQFRGAGRPCVSVAQDRIAEKALLRRLRAARSGVMPAPHKVIASHADIDAIPTTCCPAS